MLVIVIVSGLMSKIVDGKVLYIHTNISLNQRKEKGKIDHHYSSNPYTRETIHYNYKIKTTGLIHYGTNKQRNTPFMIHQPPYTGCKTNVDSLIKDSFRPYQTKSFPVLQNYT